MPSRPVVALVRPPHELGSLTAVSSSHHPINLLYLAAFLREHGFEPVLFDFELEPFDEARLVARLTELKPVVLGVSCMTPVIVTGAAVCAAAKKADPRIVTVVGGAHPTALPGRTLDEFPAFDAAVEAEGEPAFLEICRRAVAGQDLQDIGGAWTRDPEGKPRKGLARTKIDELDAIPLPARDLIDFDAYKGASKGGLPHSVYRITQLFTSRGCPFPCTFCAIHLTNKKVRYRTPETVVEEIKHCKERYGINHFTIHDDTFTIIPKRTEELCRVLGKLDITWDCDTRVDSVTEEMIGHMAANGCIRIAFGVESGSERVLKLLRKNTSREEIVNAFAWARQAGIMTSAYFIVGGHPDEKPEDVAETESLMHKIRPDMANVSIGCPYPGTQLHDQMVSENLVESQDWRHYMMYNKLPVWHTRHYSAQQLVDLQAKLIRGYYYRPAYILRRISRLRSLGELGYLFKAAKVGLSFTSRKPHNAGAAV